jgi:hypothetical protein
LDTNLRFKAHIIWESSTKVAWQQVGGLQPPLCWLLRISVLKNASPMALSDPFPLHLSIGQMAIELLTLLFTALF